MQVLKRQLRIIPITLESKRRLSNLNQKLPLIPQKRSYKNHNIVLFIIKTFLMGPENIKVYSDTYYSDLRL